MFQKTVISFFAALALINSAYADDMASISKMIASETKKNRNKGYAMIGALDAAKQKKAKGLLVNEFNIWKTKTLKASKKIEGFLNGYKKGLDKKEKLREEWEKAAHEAMLIIFDTTVFPNPDGPVSGPYIGYYKVMAKVDPAVALYEKLKAKADKDLKKFKNLSKANGIKMRDEYLQARSRSAELRVQIEKHGGEPVEMEKPLRFPMGMLFLKCENWKMSSYYFNKKKDDFYIDDKGLKGDGLDFPMEYGKPLTGYERTLFFFYYATKVDEFNVRVKATCSKTERRAVAINNQYRLALGLCPLQINNKVTQAITGHLSTITEMSHTGATEETRTVGQRVKLAGYKIKGGAGENLAESSITKAMEDWKWDGGHHRVLVEPGAVHIGVFGNNLSGMNIATGEFPPIPVYDYLLHFN